MSRTESPRSIVVGIDGSASAVLAAQWAADEAVSQARILRLVHVIEPGSEAVRLEEEYAQIALRAAHSAVETRDAGVRVELVVRRGGIGAVLVEESRYAAMICIGYAVGDSSDDARRDDSTTVTLARSAKCRLAVIGRDCAGPTRPSDPVQRALWHLSQAGSDGSVGNMAVMNRAARVPETA